MQNWLLQAYCIKLYDTIAKFLCTEKQNCRIAVIENCIDTHQLPIVSFAWAGKRYSLPFVIFNKEFQIITQEKSKNDCLGDCQAFDIVLSLFNLHSHSKEEQSNFIKKMQQLAPQAIFLEYENPERNLAYLGYFSFILSQYCVCFLEKMFTHKKNSFVRFQEYLHNGALEGILYEMPKILPKNSLTILERKHFGLGGIGMAYMEW